MSDQGASLVTLLFTDLVASTETASRVGDRAFDSLREAHFAALRSAIEANNGREVKNTGDGVMAAFSSATDAVAAAIAMQRALFRLAGGLAARIGVHAGDVVERDGDYFGLPVTIADRLCKAVDGGEIVVSSLVQMLAGSRGGFEYRDAGPLSLKGITDPMPAAYVEWGQQDEGQLPLPPVLDLVQQSALAGRIDELKRLRSHWAVAMGGTPVFVVLAGEPGIGKTRLAAELAAEVHRSGASVLAGRADEDILVPYQPFVEALGPVLGPSPLEALTELSGGVSQLGSDLGAVAQVMGTADTARRRFYEAVAAVLDEVATTRPCLLVIDDLHWADKPTLQLVRHLARRRAESRLMVVGTYRETELGRMHPLADLLGDLRRDNVVERIALSGLSTEEVGALAGAMASTGVSARVIDAIHAETEGNPFFVEEVVRELEAAGWDVERVGIPEGVKEAVGRRLSRLPEEANRVLRSAAVIGREFDLAILTRVADIDEDAGLDTIDRALDAHLVAEIADKVDRWIFTHALIRETLYGELPTSRRVRLHRRVADAIEVVHADDLDSHLAVLARHLFEAADRGDTGKAVEYSLRAAERASRAAAFDEAIRLAELGLHAHELGNRPLGERAQLLAALGDAQDYAFADGAAARPTLAEAISTAREAQAWPTFAKAVLSTLRWPDLTDTQARAAVEPQIREALRHLDPTEHGLRARLLGALANWGLDNEDPPALLLEAVEEARRSGDPAVLVDALSRRAAMLLGWAERADEARAMVDEALAMEDTRTLFSPAQSPWPLRGLLLLLDGEVDAFDAWVDEIRLQMHGVGARGGLWWLEVVSAGRKLFEGHFEDGERRARAAFEAGRAVGVGAATTMYGAQMFFPRRAAGRHREIEEGVRLAASSGIPILRAGHALLLTELGRNDDAIADLEALDPMVTAHRDDVWPPTMVLVAEAVATIGDRERAAGIYDALSGFSGQNITVGTGIMSYGAGARYLGLLATTLERFDDAEAHFTEAASLHERWRARPWLAHTWHDHARMLLARAGPGDRDRAAQLNTRARAAAQDMGMVWLRDRAADLLDA